MPPRDFRAEAVAQTGEVFRASSGYSHVWDALADAYERASRAEDGGPPLMPGWFCEGCGTFNGEAKRLRAVCRACEARR